MQSSNPVFVKVSVGKQTFCFSSECLSFAVLQQHCGASATFSFQDTEGDTCTVRSDVLLQSALDLARFLKWPVLRLACGSSSANPAAAPIVAPVAASVSSPSSKPAMRKVARASSVSSRLTPAERHIVLGQLIDEGFLDMTANLRALNNCTTLQEVRAVLRGQPTVQAAVEKADAGLASRPCTDFSPSQRHLMLGQLLSEGFTDMTANLRVLSSCRTIEEARALLRGNIPFQVVSRPQAPPAQPPVHQVTPAERHLILGQLLSEGFEDMTANLRVLDKCCTIEEARARLRAIAKGETSTDSKGDHVQSSESNSNRSISGNPNDNDNNDNNVHVPATVRHEALGRLIEAGFVDVTANLRALSMSNNDVARAIELLLASRTGDQ